MRAARASDAGTPAPKAVPALLDVCVAHASNAGNAAPKAVLSCEQVIAGPISPPPPAKKAPVRVVRDAGCLRGSRADLAGCVQLAGLSHAVRYVTPQPPAGRRRARLVVRRDGVGERRHPGQHGR